MKKILIGALVTLPLLFGACTSEKPAQQNDQGQEQQTPPAGGGETAAAVVHDVKCGCSIDGIGRCGNYILIDGKYVPLVHPSLGKMEFCAQKDAGAKIETVGALKDGKFVAESWKLVE